MDFEDILVHKTEFACDWCVLIKPEFRFVNKLPFLIPSNIYFCLAAFSL